MSSLPLAVFLERSRNLVGWSVGSRSVSLKNAELQLLCKTFTTAATYLRRLEPTNGFPARATKAILSVTSHNLLVRPFLWSAAVESTSPSTLLLAHFCGQLSVESSSPSTFSFTHFCGQPVESTWSLHLALPNYTKIIQTPPPPPPPRGNKSTPHPPRGNKSINLIDVCDLG